MSNLNNEQPERAQYIEDVNSHIFSQKKVVQVGRMSHVQTFLKKGLLLNTLRTLTLICSNTSVSMS